MQPLRDESKFRLKAAFLLMNQIPRKDFWMC